MKTVLASLAVAAREVGGRACPRTRRRRASGLSALPVWGIGLMVQHEYGLTARTLLRDIISARAPERQSARAPERQSARAPERQSARAPERQSARAPERQSAIRCARAARVRRHDRPALRTFRITQFQPV